MTTWQWPQFVLAVWIALAFIIYVVSWARDRDLSSEQVTLRILLMALLDVVYIYVLHAGGLW